MSAGSGLGQSSSLCEVGNGQPWVGGDRDEARQLRQADVILECCECVADKDEMRALEHGGFRSM